MVSLMGRIPFLSKETESAWCLLTEPGGIYKAKQMKGQEEQVSHLGLFL